MIGLWLTVYACMKVYGMRGGMVYDLPLSSKCTMSQGALSPCDFYHNLEEELCDTGTAWYLPQDFTIHLSDSYCNIVHSPVSQLLRCHSS